MDPGRAGYTEKYKHGGRHQAPYTCFSWWAAPCVLSAKCQARAGVTASARWPRASYGFLTKVTEMHTHRSA